MKIRSLADKVVVITGAGCGIGRACAHEFLRYGADLVISDIDKDRLLSVEEELRPNANRILACQADVTNRAAMKEFADEAIAKMGRVDILLNNAGFSLTGKMENIGLDDWQSILDVNVMGVVHGIHFFLPTMIKQRSGKILNISSGSGFTPMVFGAPYVATKYAVLGLSECLWMELARYGISVTAICPGPVRDTNFIKDGKITDGEVEELILPLFSRLSITPEKLAKRIVRACFSNDVMVRVPFSSLMMNWIVRFAPFLNRALNRKLIQKVA